MEVVTTAPSSFALHTRILAPTPTPCRTLNPNLSLTSSSSPRASLAASFLSPSAAGSVSGEFFGAKLRPNSLSPALFSRSKARRGVVTMVIPFTSGSAWEQPPPDLASYLFKNRIVYLGMSLVPSVTELMLAEFLYLQQDDADKPIYLYINSTGTTKGGEKLGYETEALAIYDVMRNVLDILQLPSNSISHLDSDISFSHDVERFFVRQTKPFRKYQQRSSSLLPSMRGSEKMR